MLLGNESRKKFGNRQVFTKQQEQQLVEYIKTCSNMNYGLAYERIRKSAFDFAMIIDGCKFPDEWRMNKKSGLSWIQGFMKIHGDISLRKPESTSLLRASAFNEIKVAEFFKLLENLLTKFKFEPRKIWNLDESR